MSFVHQVAKSPATGGLAEEILHHDFVLFPRIHQTLNTILSHQTMSFIGALIIFSTVHRIVFRLMASLFFNAWTLNNFRLVWRKVSSSSIPKREFCIVFNVCTRAYSVRPRVRLVGPQDHFRPRCPPPVEAGPPGVGGLPRPRCTTGPRVRNPVSNPGTTTRRKAVTEATWDT